MAVATSGAQTGWVTGRRIGAYTLVRELARGGMAELWLARQQGAGAFERIVAVKRIIPSTEEDPSSVTLFLDEARIAAQLTHPNVVQVYDFTEADGSFALVMEYLQGQSLSRMARAVLKARPAMDPFTAAFIVSQAAAGLGYAHLKRGMDGKPLGIVHRDVSPQNIFVTYDGYVKVLDFGIAVAAGRLSHTNTGTVRGKVAYMAPEQVLGTPLDARADVFALGIILFELLTGTRLYGGAEDLAILRTLSGSSPYPGPREYRPQVPEELDAVVRRALERDPARRYAHGEELHHALESFVRAHPPPPLRATMQQLFADKIAEQEQLLESLPAAASAETSKLSEQSLVAHTPKDAAFAPRPSAGMSTGTMMAAVRPSKAPLIGAAVAVGALLVAGGLAVGRGSSEQGPSAGKATTAAVSTAAPGPGSTPAPGTPPAGPGGATTGATGAGPVDAGQAPGPAVAALDGPPPGSPGPLASAGATNGPAGSEPAAPVTPTATAPRGQPPGPHAPSTGPGQPTPGAQVRTARGKLTLDSSPWTRVMLGKTSLGDTPLVEVPVPAGRQRLRLINEEERIDQVVEVDITPGATTVKKLSF